jgi:hypothetical protein
MIRMLTCATVFLAASFAAPSWASPPERFAKQCVETLSEPLSRKQKKKLRNEHEAYCQCLAEGGQRLGFSRHEFAIERARMERSGGTDAGGRIRQVSAKCQDDVKASRTARSPF